MSQSDPATILRIVHAEIEEAVATILNEAEASLALLSRAQEADFESFDALQESLGSTIRACMFQDLTGQRLVIAANMLAQQQASGSTPTGLVDDLLNGPALPGEGVDQGEIDRLLARTTPAPAPACG